MTGKHTITVELQYFAQLREQAGTGAERVETFASSVAELYEELRGKHGFTLPPQSLRAAVNAEFVAWHQALSDGDAVVFIPPVSGG